MSAPPVRDAIDAAVTALAAAGCDTPRLDAELLIADALGVDRARIALEPDLPVPGGASRLIAERIRRRLAREPVAYILGRKGFRYIELMVDRRVLVPRPETELLVEWGLELPRGARVHDVGTGSGAVALALAHERPDLRVSASDLSEGAVEVARANAARLGLAVEIRVARGLPEGYTGAVVANLPYVAEAELPGLEPEVARHEPAEALVFGADGLDAIRELVVQAPAGIPIALEHSGHQAEAVRALLREAASRRDLAGHERVTTGIVP